MAAFVALALRGALYTLSDNTAWLIGVQLLDGVGAGLMGALFPIVVADLPAARHKIAPGRSEAHSGGTAARLVPSLVRAQHPPDCIN